MIRSILTAVVCLVLALPIGWGYGKYQNWKGKSSVVCVSGKKPVARGSDQDPFAGIPFPFNMIVQGIGGSFF